MVHDKYNLYSSSSSHHRTKTTRTRPRGQTRNAHTFALVTYINIYIC